VKALLQVLTLIALAIDVASAVMLYWTAQSPEQDASGAGMAEGLLGVTVVAIAISILALLFSLSSRSQWPAAAALVIAVIAMIPIVLPALQ